MTVTKGKKTYTFPNGSSANNSDGESLHLGSVSSSDAESLVNEPIQRPIVLKPSRTSRIEELLVLRRCSGRKKLRRYQNRCFLQTLAEEDEDYGDGAVIIMEPYDSPFARLLRDDTALNIWNEFVEKTEQEQAKIISEFSKFQKQNIEDKTKTKTYFRISNKIKRTIKLRKNLSLESVKESEDELIAFFRATPCDIYSKFPASYFSRLLLHALAQYHGLKSLSMIQNGAKKIDVLNPSKHEWMPAECFLADFVMELRNEKAPE